MRTERRLSAKQREWRTFDDLGYFANGFRRYELVRGREMFIVVGRRRPDWPDRAQATAALVPPAGLEDTLVATLEEYGNNARFPHADGLVEGPDGELVMIYDPDAGF
jgi:hypothetical protein